MCVVAEFFMKTEALAMSRISDGLILSAFFTIQYLWWREYLNFTK